ncbi:MAG TPA: hypothetical protein VLU99_00775 [Nitrososphaerales archaeon]|nr:hypothetical protein [Nitrososphaerales archaeon]HUK74293.1 hypothetical protein [Nitrososphaerales archaeon]
MPAPQASLLAQLAKTQYISKAVKLPPDWDAGLEDEVNGKTPEFGPGLPKPTNLFIPPSTKKIAVDAANAISDGFNEFIDDIAKAICAAWANWHSTVKFVGVIINGPIGILPPAGMIGGGMMATPMILSQFNQKSANYTLYGSAVAFAIGQAWTAWELGYTNLSIPFPAGAVASTTMPPSPSVPIPIASGMSPGDALMDASMLKTLMSSQVAPPGPHDDELFDSIAQAFNQVFTIWKGTAMISNIMGAGGVAPPPPAPPGPVAGAIGNGGAVQ